MSQLESLKGQVISIASDAKATANGLSSFKSKFSAAVGAVTSTVGGSAQRLDKSLVEALQAAEKQVDAAVAALQTAAQQAETFARSL